MDLDIPDAECLRRRRRPGGRRPQGPRRHRRPRHPPRPRGRHPGRPPSRPRPAAPATRRRDRSRGGWSANLLLHLDLATLADLAVHGITGPVYDERRGTATTDLIREWLTQWLGPTTKIKVQPWLDLSHPEDHRGRSTGTTPPDRDGRLLPAPRPVLRLPRLHQTITPAATSTTSWPTSHPTTADHPARPTPTTSPHSAEDTTAPRPTADGPTDASPTADTAGPPPPAAPSTYHPPGEYVADL